MKVRRHKRKLCWEVNGQTIGETGLADEEFCLTERLVFCNYGKGTGAGNTGIAYWLNSFLDLDDSECISEYHPAVGQIKAWVDEQYANGRVIPITDEEIISQGGENHE